MPCETCYTKDERIIELEARVRYLEAQADPIFPVHVPNPPHPDLDTQIQFKFSENELSHSDRKW